VKQLQIVTAIIAFCLGVQLLAQVERVLPRRGVSSLEGTEFVVGFMQNELLEVGEDPRLQLFISSQHDATVRIVSAFSGESLITVAAQTVHIEEVHPYHVCSASEMPQQKSIFISSDAPIVVYVLNTLARSTDSYAAIPIRHLGTRYYSVNRPSDRYPRSNDPTSSMLRSGEFMVMAVEDDTYVEIDPKATTKRLGFSPGTKFSTRLNRGDCYLVQARPITFGGDDLTGTSITSTKPVAVVSGHMRTSIPLDSSASKDHLIEQLPPVTKWGRQYATAPFAMAIRPDLFRVMSSVENQEITLQTSSGMRKFVLGGVASWVDTTLGEPASWSSTEPFFLMQHMPSQSGTQTACDPAMVVVPAAESFVDEALFQFPTLEPIPTAINQRFFYYVNVLATAEAVPTLSIGGRLVSSIAPKLATQVVPGTRIHWAQIPLEQKAYVLRCDSGSFSAIMYGTSDADSYANLVGLAFEPIRRRDYSPPEYSADVTCGTIQGKIRDVSVDTALLQDVTVMPVKTFNYRWTISEPIDSTGARDFEASVRDLSRDAQIVIHAYDNRGNGKEWLYRYEAPSINVDREIVIDARANEEACVDVVIRNRDSLPVVVESLERLGNQRIDLTGPDVPFTIPAQDSVTFRVCAQLWDDSAAMAATIVIHLPCGLRHQVYVKTRRAARLLGDTVHLGDVRIGDTACGRVGIINNGDSPCDVIALARVQIDSSITVDTSGLNLPRMIAPNDTLWVRVCFVAKRKGPHVRVDSVVSSTSSTAYLVVHARGVAPDVRSVICDWSRRRLGSQNDTVVWLKNYGDASCIAYVDTLEVPATMRIDVGILARGVRIEPGDSVSVTASFAPLRRDSVRVAVPLRIDWQAHAPVQLEYRGVGIMPDVSVQDIMFDSIIVRSRRDSLVALLATGFEGGNCDLAVRSVRVLGPDSTSFVLPDTLLQFGGQSLTYRSSLDGLVTFAPLRIGRHECFVEIESDADLYGSTRRSVFRLAGVALPKPLASPVPSISTALQVLPCSPEPVSLTVENIGNAPAVIDSVLLLVNGSKQDLMPSTRLRLAPSERWLKDVDVSWRSDAPPIAVLRVVDSAGMVYDDSVAVTLLPVGTQITAQIEGAPIQSTGPAWMTIAARLEAVQEESMPSLRLAIPRTRFVVDTPDSCVVVHRRGTESIPVPASIEQNSTSIDVKLRTPLRGPWEVLCRLRGTVLWDQSGAVPFYAVLDSTACYPWAKSESGSIVVDPCGSNMRIVSVGIRSMVRMEVLGQPVHEVLSLRIHSTTLTTSSLWAESLSGEQFPISEQLSLQKGSQHCNFSCSSWASGLYRLLLRHEHGVEVTNIIIVN
jgi:hypothetical protein